MALRIILGALIGGGIGSVIGYFGRCRTGVCPLYRSPYSGAIVGIFYGLIIALSFK